MSSKKNTAISLIPTPTQLKELSKKELQAVAKQTANTINEEGKLDQLEVYLRLRKLEDFAKAAADAIKEAAYKEANKIQGKGKFEKHGAEFTHTTVSTSWDYSNCNDPLLERYQRDLEEAKQNVAVRQAYLQGVPKGAKELDEETGEHRILNRAVKSSKEGLSVKY